MVAARYALLHQLHQQLQPHGYLEIGVQSGGSLALAACPALGIDPAPMISVPLEENHHLYISSADLFFERVFTMDTSVMNLVPKRLDLIFIDGMHLAEFALRDFINCEKISHSDTVIVFDDVLPYNEAIATREQPPGDWTGDVWKIISVLRDQRRDLTLTLVDTFPTGTLIVTNVNPVDHTLYDIYDNLERDLLYDVSPPHWVISREGAVSQEVALENVMKGRS